MSSVRLAKEVHFKRTAEDKVVPGERSIIRLGEPTTRRVRAICRRVAPGTFRRANPRRSQNHSVGLSYVVATMHPSQIRMPNRIQILAHSSREPPVDVDTLARIRLGRLTWDNVTTQQLERMNRLTTLTKTCSTAPNAIPQRKVVHPRRTLQDCPLFRDNSHSHKEEKK